MTTPHIDLKTIRRLNGLAQIATAALTPLASDGRGEDSHGGALRNPGLTLTRALVALEAAGTLAARLRLSAGHRGREANP